MTQPKPAQIEVYRGQTNAQQLAAGYQSVKKEADTIVATAKVAGAGQAAFAVEDRWTVTGPVLSLSRKVSVTGAEDNAGFYSAIRLSAASTVKWEDANCLVPGLTYGNSVRGGRGGAPVGGTRRYSLREDVLSAPMISVLFQDGNWAAVMDLAPKGDTTQAETTASAGTTIIDDRIQFGALGAQEAAGGGAELGFWLPGTTVGSPGGFGRGCGAASLSSGEGRVLAELPGRISLRKIRDVPRHGTRGMALGLDKPQAQGGTGGHRARPQIACRSLGRPRRGRG